MTPTFNGISIKPNTSFKLEAPGIMTSVLTRRNTLKPGELEFIQETAGDTYARALSIVASLT